MFQFQDITGQEETKQKLLKEFDEKRIPNALLLYGPEGTGKMALALAFARLLLCQKPNGDDACGTCPSCLQMDKLVHPDLHFVFPVMKNGKETISDDYIKEWREFLLETPYPSLDKWSDKLKVGNSQPGIFSKESDDIIRKLSLKSSENGYKVMIIWMPEKMREDTENKILKILEEPPLKTVFIMVSDNPENILQTIKSRTQNIQIPPISEKNIAEALHNKWQLGEKDAADVAHLANGNMLKAIETITNNEADQQNLILFMELMRLSYMRNIKDLKGWSEKMAAIGREKQKNFLEYAQHMVRENFINNFHNKELVYMNAKERNFAIKFSPYINEYNAIGLMNELDLAEQHIIQNVNAKMVFFDFVLKTIMLLKH